MELVYKVLVKETCPNSSGWYDTNEGNIYWNASKEVWSSRDDRVSEEFPVWWLETNIGSQSSISKPSQRYVCSHPQKKTYLLDGEYHCEVCSGKWKA